MLLSAGILRIAIGVIASPVAVVSATGQAPLAAADAESKTLVPLSTKWPASLQVAVFAANGTNATAVEVTSSGWVVLRPLQHWSEARDGDHPPTVYVRPQDILRWSDSLRSLVHSQLDISPGTYMPWPLPDLGRGRAKFVGYVRNDKSPRPVMFWLATCGGPLASYNATADVLIGIAGVLESAARLAYAAAPEPAPVDRARPHYRSEVSCAAASDSTNDVPRFPHRLPRGVPRRYTEVGVQYVVDTAGAVEPASVGVLPGTSSFFARAARELVTNWRFRPGERDGTAVRQIVTSTIAFDPDAPDSGFVRLSDNPDVRRTTARGDSRGWVHVRSGYWRRDGTFDGYREWVRPEMVDAWVTAARQLLAADAFEPRYPPPPTPNPAAVLGYEAAGNSWEMRYQEGWGSDSDPLRFWGTMRGCDEATIRGEWVDSRTVSMFAAAAAEARRRRRNPAPQAARLYAGGELACTAWLQPHRTVGFGNWLHRGAPYPESMLREHARAEVLSSFVVNTEGIADPATLVVMPGSDPRAVAALRDSLAGYRFRPASRAGTPVQTRVIKTWVFAPPNDRRSWNAPARAKETAIRSDTTQGRCAERDAAGCTVVELRQGDYGDMAFSPSGRYLVIADHVEAEDTLVTQLVLYDFERQRLDTILAPEVARRYVHYIAVATDFEWNGDTLLVARFFDGDVGEAFVTLRMPEGTVLKEEFEDAPEINPPPDSVLRTLARLYPEGIREGDTLGIFWYAMTERAILGPAEIVAEYWGEGRGSGVWLFGLDERRMVQLQPLPDGQGFAGGFSHGSDIVFVSGGDTVTVSRWSPGQLEPLFTFPGSAATSMVYVRHAQGDSIWFVVRSWPIRPDKRNPVLLYAQGRVTELVPELSTWDMQMHTGRGLIAFNIWRGSERHILVRRF